MMGSLFVVPQMDAPHILTDIANNPYIHSSSQMLSHFDVGYSQFSSWVPTREHIKSYTKLPRERYVHP